MIQLPANALVRRIAKIYAEFYLKKYKIPVSLQLAEAQHAVYVSALKASGLEVSYVEANNEQQDCVFIEDTAIH